MPRSHGKDEDDRTGKTRKIGREGPGRPHKGQERMRLAGHIKARKIAAWKSAGRLHEERGQEGRGGRLNRLLCERMWNDVSWIDCSNR